MADEKTTIEIEVRAKDLSKNVLRSMGTNASRAGNIATRAFAKVGRAAVRAAAGIGRMATSIARGLTRAVTGLLGPLAVLAGAGGLLFAVKSASDFRKAMAEVSTLLVGSGTNMDDLRDATIEMAQQLGTNEVEQAAGLYAALSAGVGTAVESMRFLEEATRLSIGGVATTAEGVGALVTVMNGWKKENFDLEKTSDLLFKTVELGSVTISELAANLGQVSSVAKGAGISLEETLAVVAVMTAGTQRVAESFTSMKAAINVFSAATPETIAGFRRLGIEIDAASIASGGFISVIERLAAANLNADQIAALIPGQEAQAAFKPLILNVEKLTAALDGMNNSAGASAAAFERVFQDPAARISRLLNAIRIEFVKMGDTILLSIDDAIESSGGIKVLTGNFEVLAAVIGDLAGRGVSALGVVAGGISRFVTNAGGPEVVAGILVGAMGVLFDLLATGARGVVDAVFAMIEAIKLLPAALQQVASKIGFLNVEPPTREVTENVFGDERVVRTEQFDALKELQGLFVMSPEVQAKNEASLAVIRALWDQVKESVRNYGKEVEQSGATVGETLVALRNEILGTTGGDMFKEQTVQAESFFEVVKRGATTFGILAESAEQFTLTLGSQLANGVFDGFRGFFRDVISGAKSAGDAIKDFGKQMILMIADLIAQTIAFGIVKSLFGLPLGFPAFAKGGIVPVAKAAKGAVVGPGIHMSGAGPIEVGDNPERSEVILPLRHGPRGLGVESFGGAQSQTINFSATFQSIDPQQAADVILQAMPEIEAKLTYALTSGTNAELIRAVGGA